MNKVANSRKPLKGSSSRGEDEYATFFYSEDEGVRDSGDKIARWIRPGDSVEVGGWTITNGNFYLGSKIDNGLGWQIDASLVDDSLNFDMAMSSESDNTLSYHPHFSRLSPRCRGAYLTWLSGERKDPNTPIGYVFIYFFGLERRVIIDSIKKDLVSDDEFVSLEGEIRRLLSIYGSNDSFRGYASRLIDWMMAIRPKAIKPKGSDIVDLKLTQTLSLYLGKAAAVGKPLPAKVALHWLHFIPSALKTAAVRCKKEFEALFTIEYQKEFFHGMILEPGLAKLHLSIKPASPTLTPAAMDYHDLPQVMHIPKYNDELYAVANMCMKKLGPYSRYIGKFGYANCDIKAMLELPEELCNSEFSEAYKSFSSWADEMIKNHFGVVSLDQIWGFIDRKTPQKLSKKNIETILSIVIKTGYGIVPDPRYHKESLFGDDQLILHKPKSSEVISVSDRYNQYVLAIKIFAIAADQFDETIGLQRRIFLFQVIQTSGLPVDQRESLNLYTRWIVDNPRDLTESQCSEKKLQDYALRRVAGIILHTALTYFNDHAEMVAVARSAYRMLTGEEPEQDKVAGSNKESKIDTPPPKFELNEKLISARQNETREVQNLLGEIFSDEEESSDDTQSADQSSTDKDCLPGLNATYSAFYRHVISRNEWSKTELEDQCQSHGLMLDGALETLNDWSLDNVDEPLLEDEGDTIIVDQETVTQISNIFE